MSYVINRCISDEANEKNPMVLTLGGIGGQRKTRQRESVYI